MKQVIFLLLLFSAVASHASEHYNNIICENSSGFVQVYSREGKPYAFQSGCHPTSTCAANKLSEKLLSIPETKVANYSQFFGQYVDVISKKVSKVMIESTTSRTDGDTCVPQSVPWDSDRWPQVDCQQSIACVTVSVEYHECTKVRYDPKTGRKIITCSSGQIIYE